MNYNEFSEKIKAKYPQYKDMDNRELAQKMVAKYPRYGDITFDDVEQPKQSKGFDLTPSGMARRLSAATVAPFYGAKTGQGIIDSYKELRNIQEEQFPKNFVEKGLDVALTFALPQAKVLQAGKFAPLVNNLVTGAYQGGLIGGVQGLQEGKPLEGLASGASVGGAVGASLPVAGKLAKKGLELLPQAGGLFAKTLGRIQPETLKRAVQPDSMALDLTRDEAQNLLMNTTERIQNAYKDLLVKRGQNISNIAKTLKDNKNRISVDDLKNDITSVFDSYQGDVVNPARNMTGDLEYNLIDLINKSTPVNEAGALYDEVINNNLLKGNANLGNISDELKQFAQKNGLNIDDFTNHNIDTSAIRHINKKHGSAYTEEPRGQLPVGKADIESLPRILENPDTIDYMGKNNIGRDVIKYSKTMPYGQAHYFEELRNGKKLLSGDTMYKTKNGGRAAANAALPTPEATSTNNIIADNEAYFNSISPVDLQKLRQQIGHMVNWSDATAKNYQNPILERIYGKFADRLNALSPELAQANADYALLRAFQKNEGLRRILKPGDNIDTASSALRNYNSTVTKGNTNRNIQDLEKLMVKEGYSPFLNNIDDVNAAMDLLNARTTGDSWLANLATQMTRPVLKVARGVNRRMENIPEIYKNIGAQIPEAIRRLITLGAVNAIPLQGEVQYNDYR